MRIDGSGQWDNLITNAALNILGKMNPGDVVRAKILEIQSNELLLKLLDGTLLTAKTDIDLAMFEGKTLNFEITGKDGEKILLKPLTEEIPEKVTEHEQIKARLAELGIKPDSESIETARELKSHNLPVTAENLAKVLEAVKGFKNMDIPKAVFFVASKLEFTEKNIEMLNYVLNKSNGLGAKLDRLLEALLGTDNKEIVIKVAERLKALNGQQGLNEEAGINAAESHTADNHTASIKVNEFTVNGHTLNELTDGLLSEADGKNVKALIENSNFKNSLTEFFKENKLNESIPEKTEAFVKEFLNNTGIQFSAKEANDLIRIISRFASRLIKENARQEAKLPEKAAESIIRQAFENFHIRVSEERSLFKTEIRNLYRDMYMKLEVVKETLNMFKPDGQNEIKGTIENIQSSIIFLNEINNYNAYIQIPLNLPDFKTT